MALLKFERLYSLGRSSLTPGGHTDVGISLTTQPPPGQGMSMCIRYLLIYNTDEITTSIDLSLLSVELFGNVCPDGNEQCKDFRIFLFQTS